ncbi:hypothetical protein [Iningainema tapete]|uniref:Uncharacterized protein n=1 Tax=Iningainema tapete BLCC-T55 TaxID=2748662 RepID=A0A8J6XMR7_9CYAN|nr:hypothetical protein [Iningainema tapete]MBD2773841.1 hypothetical protein [Iningainema tapete BLCC-T55]
MTEKAEAEPEFAQELKRLVQDTIQDKNVGQFLTQVFGGEVGQILNINQAGNITFNENK